jgi:multidrug efflux pump subunit AcrA (membrane-fusion protein)
MMSTNQEDSLPQVQENEFLPRITSWSTYGGLLATGAVLMGIMLASITKYTVSINSSVSLQMGGELMSIQAPINGHIDDILVATNQKITKGQVLVVMNNGALQVKKRQIQLNIRQSNLQLSQINFQMRSLNRENLLEKKRITLNKVGNRTSISTFDNEAAILRQHQQELQNQLEQDTRELRQVEKEISQTVISAPIDGVIANLNPNAKNRDMRLGEQVLQISPNTAPVFVKALVSDTEIGNLKRGQNIRLNIVNCSHLTNASFNGTIKSISQANNLMAINKINYVAKLQASNRVMKFSEILINVPKISEAIGSSQCNIQFGSEQKAVIVSRDKTVLQFLLDKVGLNQ